MTATVASANGKLYNPMGKILCGVDLGGTKLAAALFEQDGTLIAKELVYDHRKDSCDEVVLVIVELLTKLFKENGVDTDRIAGIGTALAGHILYEEGRIITTSNFPVNMEGYPFADKLGAYFPGVKILLDNDANAQAYGEYKYGAGRGSRSLVFVTVSTGIGSGIILDGKVIRGQSGTAGEIGHCIVDYKSDVRCSCGNYGCAMALASGLFFPDLYRMYMKKGLYSTIDITEEDVDQVDGRMILKGIRSEDPVSCAVAENSAVVVGTSLFNIFSMLDPELVVLGGGLMALGEDYIKRIVEEFHSHTHGMMYKEMKIKLAETGADAGLLGAASLILEG